MSRCPYLEYIQGTGGFASECEYVCKLCYQHMYATDAKIKYTCDAEYGDSYRNCAVYQKS